MKTPAFWYRSPGALAALLSPLSLLWREAGRTRRRHAVPEKVGTPFIVVGNAVAGGAGKTPVVMALAERLGRTHKVHLMAKGYGGRLEGPLQVDPDRHAAAEVGDEPLLLARLAPTFIGRDRLATAKIAAMGADVLISDDGLQNPFLAPDLALLVVDGVMKAGNGRVMPAGPLREPLADVLSRVTAVVQIGGAPDDYGGRPVLMADLNLVDAEWMKGARLLPFAGLGRPEKFFAACAAAGGHVAAARAFPDHHPYTEAEIHQLIAEAESRRALLVTTAKDLVRVPKHLCNKVRIVQARLVWREPDALDRLLDSLLPR